MKNRIQKYFAFLLALAMLLGMMPASPYALAGTEDSSDSANMADQFSFDDGPIVINIGGRDSIPVSEILQVTGQEKIFEPYGTNEDGLYDVYLRLYSPAGSQIYEQYFYYGTKDGTFHDGTVSGLDSISYGKEGYLIFYIWGSDGAGDWVTLRNGENYIYFHQDVEKPIRTDGIFVYEEGKNGTVRILSLTEDYAGDGNIVIPDTAELKDPETGETGTYKVTGVCDSAFEGESRIITVTFANNDTIKVGRSAFDSIENLESVRTTGTGALQLDGSYAFWGNTGVKSIEIHVTDSKYLTKSTFSYCYDLEKLVIHDDAATPAVFSTGSLSDSSNLKHLEIHGNLKTIPALRSVFPRLETLIIESKSDVSIYSSAFYNLETLKTVRFSGGACNIGSYAFYGNTALESAEFNGGVTSIGNYAFYGDSALASFTAATRSGTPAEIGNSAFRYDSALVDFSIGDTPVKTIGSYAFADSAIGGNFRIKTDNATVRTGAFQHMENLTGLTFDGNVAEFGTSALGTWVVNERNPEITSVIVTGHTGKVGSNSFYGMPKLKAVVFQGGADSFDTEVFGGGTMDPGTAPFTFVYVGDNGSTTTLNQYIVYANRTESVHMYFNMSPDKVIDTKNALPNHVSAFYAAGEMDEDLYVNLDSTEDASEQDGSAEHPFSSFESAARLLNAFSSNVDGDLGEQFLGDKAKAGVGQDLPFSSGGKKLVTLHISSTEKDIEIPNYAFQNNTVLKAVTVNAEGKNFTAGISAFYGCPHLESLTFEKPIAGFRTTWYSFQNTALRELNIPHTGDVYLGPHSFRDNPQLAQVTILNPTSGSNDRTSGMIGGSALENCTALTSFESDIGYYSDQGDDSGVAWGAFGNDKNLRTVIFHGAADIHYRAFDNCTGLKTMRVDNLAESSIEGDTFPAGLKNASFVADGDTAYARSGQNVNLTGFENLVLSGAAGGNADWMLPDSGTVTTLYISADYDVSSLANRLGSLKNVKNVYIAQDRDAVETADDLIAALPAVSFHFLNDRDVEGLYISGSGNDETGDGSRENPVKTFGRLKELIQNQQEGRTKETADTVIGPLLNEVYQAAKIRKTPEEFVTTYTYEPIAFVLKTVQVTGDETWDCADLAEPLVLYRAEDNKQPMVQVSGVLTLKNVVLDGNQSKVTAEGSIIKANRGATLNIESGATLRNNAYPRAGWDGDNWLNGGAVYADHATVNLREGSLIENNLAMAGGGVMMNGGTLNMTGGTVRGNTAKAAIYANNVAVNGYGGGVTLIMGATMNLSGGLITENKADGQTSYGIGINGSVGGGIHVGSGYANQATFATGSTLNMTGGTVSDNTAYGQGGGIYVQASCVANVSGGAITGNRSGGGEFGGGGIYVNGSRGYGTVNGLLNLTNVLISGNDATYGGGIANCETVDLSIFMGRGAAIYGNYDSRKGWDNDIFFFQRQTGYGTKATISQHMMNGADYNWTFFTFSDYEAQDERIAAGQPVPVEMLANIDAGDLGHFAIRSNPSDTAVNADVVISGNYAATKGGGIGSNGNIVIGDAPAPQDVSLTPGGDKVVIGRDMKDGEEYTFSVYLEKSSVSYGYYDGNYSIIYSYEDVPVGEGSVAGAENGTAKKIELPSYTLEKIGKGSLGERYTLLVLEKTRSTDALIADEHTYYAFHYIITQGKDEKGGNAYQAYLYQVEKGTYTRDADGNPVFETEAAELEGMAYPYIRRARETVELKDAVFMNYPLDREAEAKKVWMDGEEEIEAPEGASVTFELLADGKPARDLKGEPVPAVVLDGTADTDNEDRTGRAGETSPWLAHWENLPVYSDADHSAAIVYTVVETARRPESFAAETAGVEAGTDGLAILVNRKISIEPEETEATVRKIWNDANNRDGIRPEELKVRLSNGTEVVLSEANEWTATVEHLPKLDTEGKEIAYTWTETDVPEGYELTDVSVDGTVTTLTNTHEPEMTVRTVRKIWNDGNNQTGARPGRIIMTLSANGVAVRRVELNAANGWTATIADLPVNEAGEPLAYMWSEQAVPGYRLTGTATEGTVTTFTNQVVMVPEVPGNQPQPKTPGKTWRIFIFEEYETALGGEHLLNHVGDCFD